ncbi:MAG TPA: hypothetical protein VET66_13235 [Steroidobacteraceae bacterium]|nr:hypothetical protein [Steroidobacteraceae bacterium]
MNEIEVIRAQLRLETEHALAAARAAIGTGGSLRPACEAYLEWVLRLFAERERRLTELTHAQSGAPEPLRRALAAVLGGPGSSSEALEALRAAREGVASWRELAGFLEGDWQRRRGELDAALGPHRRVADWRSALGLRAEGILRERELYARVAGS